MIQARQIIQYAQQLAVCCAPQQILLFGSYAHGLANDDSDIDLLLILPHRESDVQKAGQILSAAPAPFPIDLIVRKPETVARRLQLGDQFLRDIFQRGITLYEAANPGVGQKGRRRLRHRLARIQVPQLPRL